MDRPRDPALGRFLADFTLGFSDGLTVPFALTAGLSSLGRADTVINAGLAELCAGSISMGIGGYLAAVDGCPPHDDGEEELTAMLLHDEGPGAASTIGECGLRASGEKALALSDELLIRRHLEPLALPTSAVSDVVAALRGRPDGLARAAHQLRRRPRHWGPSATSAGKPAPAPWPVASGLSIALGYVVGGVIPLLPYLFAPTVGLGLGWSIDLCLVALASFGSGKSWLLRGNSATWGRCLLQGLQMLVLGGLAAAAAALCVRLLGQGAQAPGAA